MNTFLAILTTITMSISSFAQGFQPTGDISDDMIPDTWEYLGSATGDLNNDGRADLFVVARPEGGKPVAAIYWDLGDNRWTLFKQFDNAFRPPEQMPYSPEYDIEILNDGTLKIGLYDPKDFDFNILTSYSFNYKDGTFVASATNQTNKNFGDFEIE